MKKINFHPSFLQILYLSIYLVLFALIISVPKFINGPVHLTEKLVLEEEIIEGILLGILFIVNIFIFNLYKKETRKQKKLIKKISDDKLMVKEKLDDSSKYIGQLNVQMQEIKSIFNNTHKLPETKNDFKRTLLFFINRVFGIADTDWVLFRIINCNTQKTVIEQFETKKGTSFDYPHISNKMIIEKQSCSPYTTVISSPQNLNIYSCCILSGDNISNDERIFIQAITNEITMLYIILNSSYYKSENKAFTKNFQESDTTDSILQSKK